MEDTINVRITWLPPAGPDKPPLPACEKVWLVSGKEAREGGRPLEPGEVVALPRAAAEQALAKLPYHLTRTEEPATRPLMFANSDEAAVTSQYFRPNAPGRAEEAKVAMKEVLARMAEEAPEFNEAAGEVINSLDDQRSSLDERERAIRKREIELGLREPDPVDALDDMEERLEIELEAYEASDNATTVRDVKDAREHAQAELEAELSEPAAADGEETPEPPATPRRRRQRRTIAA